MEALSSLWFRVLIGQIWINHSWSQGQSQSYSIIWTGWKLRCSVLQWEIKMVYYEEGYLQLAGIYHRFFYNPWLWQHTTTCLQLHSCIPLQEYLYLLNQVIIRCFRNYIPLLLRRTTQIHLTIAVSPSFPAEFSWTDPTVTPLDLLLLYFPA